MRRAREHVREVGDFSMHVDTVGTIVQEFVSFWKESMVEARCVSYFLCFFNKAGLVAGRKDFLTHGTSQKSCWR